MKSISLVHISVAVILVGALVFAITEDKLPGDSNSVAKHTVGSGVLENEGGVLAEILGEPCHSFADATITISEAEYSVEIADTRSQQATGLQRCAELTDSQGMYFPYRAPGTPAFWMKDVLIPLDLVWIRDNTVVGVTPNVPPAAEMKIEDIPQYRPPQEIDAVLEIAGGQAKAQGIAPGSTVQLVPQEK